MAPTGSSLDDPIVGAELKAAVHDAHVKDEALTKEMLDPTLDHRDEDLVDFPTEEERNTLRRVAGHIPVKIYTIAFIELCERFSYYGSTAVFQNFIQRSLPVGSTTGAPPDYATNSEAKAGALGMGQQAATGLTTFNQFWQYCLPLLGAWIADEYWGRYKTICVALAIDLIGHMILVMSAIPPVLTRARENSLSAFIIALLVIGFGTGGFKPNISPLVVEQLPLKHMKVITLSNGERVLVDPAVTINRVYNYFYLFINIGALVGQIGMVYAEKYVGFWLSYLLPTCVFLLCPAIMWWGKDKYDRRPPAGSVIGPAMKLWVKAQAGRWSWNPVQTWKNLHGGEMWESVKPSRFTPETRPKWLTWDDAFVDEVRRGFSACTVFMWYPIYWITYNQINNNLTSQAGTMQLNGLPNDVLQNLDPLALIILIPICDFLIYPWLRRMGFNFTPIKRITWGFFTGTLAMVWAAVIQLYIYRMSPCGWGATADDCANTPAPINVWAQTGSYILIAISEIFASITSLEYAYSKAPKKMRSFVQAVALFTTAFSSALGEAFTPLATDPLLVWNYGIAGILAFVAGCIFWLQFRHLDHEEDRLNELPEGKAFAWHSDEEAPESKPAPIAKDSPELPPVKV